MLRQSICAQLIDQGKNFIVKNFKDKSKGNVANNSRPKTCLSFIWKLLTGVIADQIYAQKGSRGTFKRDLINLIYIDRAVVKQVRSTNKNLAMAWIDYKKAYDMV